MWLFNIKGAEFTCMATCLPYKTACVPIIDVHIIDGLRYKHNLLYMHKKILFYVCVLNATMPLKASFCTHIHM